MDPFTAFFKCVFLKYASGQGRASRSEFWWYTIIYFAAFVAAIASQKTGFLVFVMLVLSIPHASVATRRMHDIGRRCWWYLIPLYGLFLACKKGDEGENRWGGRTKISEYGSPSEKGLIVIAVVSLILAFVMMFMQYKQQQALENFQRTYYHNYY